MSLPREPRQKMINMMYLVLTALLALNVSSEILNAFKTVNSGLNKSSAVVGTSTETIMASLNDKKSEAATAIKANTWYPKAEQAQQKTTEIISYISGLKDQILKEAGLDPATGKYKMDNLDIATRIMVENGAGKKLRDMLEKYKADLLAIDPAIKTEFEKSLPIDLTIPQTEHAGNNTWETANFRMVPTVAAITMLSKFENDVKNSENKVVAFCHEQVGKVIVRYDAFGAIVGQNSNYLMPGQEIEITAGVGAFSKAAKPVISIGGRTVEVGEDGAAHTKLAGGGVGSRSIPVVIRYKDQEGVDQTITKNVEYTVGQANASIALDKMNVLYIGVDNPVTIAASGGGDDRVKAGISGGGGSLSKASGNGKYIARVNSITDNCTISVNVDGKLAGSSEFRVRTVPDAAAIVGGFVSGSEVNKAALGAQAGVGAGIKNFPFDLKYSVVSFSLSGADANGDIIFSDVQGNAFNGKAKSIIQNSQSGDVIIIEKIRCLGPDGRTTTLPPLVYNIR